MLMKDKIAVGNWLRINLSYNEVMKISRYGLVENERFTDRAKEVYIFLWTWSAPRFEGLAGNLQEVVYKKHGHNALHRRYARVNRMIQNIIKGN